MKIGMFFAASALVSASALPAFAQSADPCVKAGRGDLNPGIINMLDRAQIVADEIVTGRVNTGASPLFDGNVFTNEAGFGPDAVITGDFLVGALDADSATPTVGGAFVTGAMVDTQPVDAMPVPFDFFNLVETEPDATIELEPDTYFRVLIGDRGMVTLTAGTYNVLSLETDNDVTIEFDVSDGPINFNSEDVIFLRDRTDLRVVGGDPDDVNIYTNDSLIMEYDARVEGNVTAGGAFMLDRAEIIGCVETDTIIDMGYDASIVQPN